MEQNKYDIFISYSRKDSEIVLPIVRNLESQGYVVWIDTKGIECSDQFKKKIVRIISNSTIFMFFSSENSNASEWTAKEIGIAVARNKPILPIKLDNALYNESVEFDLINLDFANYASDPQKAKEKIQKAVILHCGIPESEKEKKERERQAKLKQAELQVKYNILQDDFSVLNKKKEKLLQEMQEYGIDIPGSSSLDKENDAAAQIKLLVEEKQTLEERCEVLQIKIEDLQAKIKTLEHYIHEHEISLPHQEAIQKLCIWQKLKEGFKVRPIITSIILGLSFIAGLMGIVISYTLLFKCCIANPRHYYCDDIAIFYFPSFIVTFFVTWGIWNLLKMKKRGLGLIGIAFVLLNVYFVKIFDGVILLSVFPMAIWVLFLFIKKNGKTTWQLLEIREAINNLRDAIKSNPIITNILLFTSTIASFIFLIFCAFFLDDKFIVYLYPILLLYILWGIYLLILKKKSGLTIIHTIAILTYASFFLYVDSYPHKVFICFMLINYPLILLSLIPRYKGERFYHIISKSKTCCSSDRILLPLMLNICIIHWLFVNVMCLQNCENYVLDHYYNRENQIRELYDIDEYLNFFKMRSQYPRRLDIYDEYSVMDSVAVDTLVADTAVADTAVADTAVAE